MKKYFTVKEVSIGSLLTSLMFLMSLITFFFGNLIGKSVIQFSDVIYLSLLLVVKTPTLIVSACLSGLLIDIFSGSLVFIPITILVKILIGVTYLLFKKFVNIYFLIIIAYLWIWIYVPYNFLLFKDIAFLTTEAIIESIQYFVTIFLSIILTFLLKSKKIYIIKD